MTATLSDEIDFAAEALLDRSIQFPHPLSRNPLTPDSVFLTGATGFLGAYVLDELLHKTAATVYCLVRAPDVHAAQQRLVAHLREYGLWRDAFAERIQAVAGDLTEPRFGLSEDKFIDLAALIDVIYHSAGWLNMAFPYARLKPANVTGTQEVLRFAGTISTKPVHVLSSMAVFFTDPNVNTELLRESDAPQYHSSLRGGYTKSKWVADRLVANAQERGLPACIYRPVRIMGHSRTGAINDVSDVLPLLLKGCLLLGKYPAFDIKITLVPVDYVSRAMVHLAGQQSSWGRAFHFFHPDPIEWRRLMTILRSLGYPLEELGYDQWWRELKQRIQDPDESADRKSFLSTVMLALTAPHFLFYKRPPLDASNIHEGLKGTDIVCPPIDHSLVKAYTEYWQTSGFLPMPTGRRSLD